MSNISFTMREASALISATNATERCIGKELKLACDIMGLFYRIERAESAKIPLDTVVLEELRAQLVVWAEMDYL